jgi:hypothetical protein
MDTSRKTSLGAGFAEAFAAKDADAVRRLVHPEIDFRGLTPNRQWEAADVDTLVQILFENWLEDSDQVEALDSVETDSFADRERVGYRMRVTCPDGAFVVEQQAYIGERDGRIGWMRVVCSGFRPVI